MIVQKYLHQPHLIDGFKYDLRIYVLVMGMNPLRVYIYKDGLARFATVKYQKPDDKNLKNIYMHLTNYAINKEHENYVANTDKNNDDIGSKRSMVAIFNNIEIEIEEKEERKKGDNADPEAGLKGLKKLRNGIHDMIIKSLSLVKPMVSHLMKSS